MPIPPQRLLRPGALKRAVLFVDRGVIMRRVIPARLLFDLDELDLIHDAHLCYGLQRESDYALVPGFRARAVAYAALLMPPEKHDFLYRHVMPLHDVVRFARGQVSTFEMERAELFDHVQGGDRSSLYGKGGRRPPFDPHLGFSDELA